MLSIALYTAYSTVCRIFTLLPLAYLSVSAK